MRAHSGAEYRAVTAAVPPSLDDSDVWLKTLLWILSGTCRATSTAPMLLRRSCGFRNSMPTSAAIASRR